MRAALDRDVLKTLLHRGRDAGTPSPTPPLAGHMVCVLPLVAEELEGADGRDYRQQWRELAFEEVEASEFLMGCAAGLSRRYLDYHPDPRDCRLVAEAECAKADVLITTNEELIKGLAGRAENIRIVRPSDAL